MEIACVPAGAVARVRPFADGGRCAAVCGRSACYAAAGMAACVACNDSVVSGRRECCGMLCKAYRPAWSRLRTALRVGSVSAAADGHALSAQPVACGCVGAWRCHPAHIPVRRRVRREPNTHKTTELSRRWCMACETAAISEISERKFHFPLAIWGRIWYNIKNEYARTRNGGKYL